jgi:hypothetical protein
VTTNEAWDILFDYARRGGLSISAEMSIQALKRTLAKKYHPRKSSDDSSAMQKINACLAIVADEQSKRELCGKADQKKPNDGRGANSASGTTPGRTGTTNGFGGFKSSGPPSMGAPDWMKSGRPGGGFANGFGSNGSSSSARPGFGANGASVEDERLSSVESAAGAKSFDDAPSIKHSPIFGCPPWQTDAADGVTIAEDNYADVNYIRKELYDRSIRFGEVELIKAWAWDGFRFQKVISVWCNRFTFEELGRGLMYYQANGPNPVECEAVFITRGAGRIRHFKLALIQLGVSCEDVSKYDFIFECEPDAADFQAKISTWLGGVEARLRVDSRFR